LDDLRQNGLKGVIFSDYPAAEKTEAVGLVVDGVYCSKDSIIGALKPSPKGLSVIAYDYSVASGEKIVIGDREVKDGLCAKTFDADFYLCRAPHS